VSIWRRLLRRLNAGRVFEEALNKSPQMRGARIGMGCKADFAANIWILARNSTPQTARVRVIARCEGLVRRFLRQLLWLPARLSFIH
jgi:hypothetical protein